jgi:hypothetical protein
VDSHGQLRILETLDERGDESVLVGCHDG